MLERDFQNEVIRRIGRDIYGEGLRAGAEHLSNQIQVLF